MRRCWTVFALRAMLLLRCLYSSLLWRGGCSRACLQQREIFEGEGRSASRFCSGACMVALVPDRGARARNRQRHRGGSGSGRVVCLAALDRAQIHVSRLLGMGYVRPFVVVVGPSERSKVPSPQPEPRPHHPTSCCLLTKVFRKPPKMCDRKGCWARDSRGRQCPRRTGAGTGWPRR